MGERKIFNKLIRDNVVEIIKKHNATPKVRIMNDDEYIQALRDKLYEEINEFFASDNDINELADVKEVFNALCLAKGHTLKDVEKARVDKAKKRGGFEKKIFLIETIENDL